MTGSEAMTALELRSVGVPPPPFLWIRCIPIQANVLALSW